MAKRAHESHVQAETTEGVMEKAKSQVATIEDLERKLKRQADDCRDLSALYTSRYHRLQGRYRMCSIYLLVLAPIINIVVVPKAPWKIVPRRRLRLQAWTIAGRWTSWGYNWKVNSANYCPATQTDLPSRCGEKLTGGLQVSSKGRKAQRMSVISFLFLNRSNLYPTIGLLGQREDLSNAVGRYMDNIAKWKTHAQGEFWYFSGDLMI